jgi:hypothetical protein
VKYLVGLSQSGVTVALKISTHGSSLILSVTIEPFG